MHESISGESIENEELKCLIANDDPLQLTILETLFEKLNFNVTTAINGQSAYEEVRKFMIDQNSYFDLILLDLNMPVTDGYEACSKILQIWESSSVIKKRNKVVRLNSNQSK